MDTEPDAQALPAGVNASPQAAADVPGTSGGLPKIEPAETAAVEGMLYDPESSSEPFESGSEAVTAPIAEVEETAEQFGTIDVAGSPHKKSESAGPENTPEEGNTH
jgi:hypothetical protein